MPGLLVCYNQGIIILPSTLQKAITLSTVEVEYYTASEVAMELIYILNPFENMSFATRSHPDRRGQNVH